MKYAILTLITALVFAMATYSSPGARLRDLPRRIRRQLHWYFVVRPRVLRRPIAGGALTDVTDGSRVIAEGIAPCQVALSEAALPGDLLGKSGSTWVLADGNNSVYAELIAGQKGASGDTITAFRIARVSALSGAAIGDPVYLSDTAGGYSATAGTVGQVVGFALSATEVLLFPNYTTGGQLIAGALKQFFRDSGLYIHSSADGKLTISSDGSGADDITLDGTVTINDNVTMAAAKGITQSGAATNTLGAITQVAANGIAQSGAAENTFGQVTMLDAKDVVLNSTTGTKIGTAVGQKLGFWNATPIVQPSGANQGALGAVTTVGANTGTAGAGLTLIGSTNGGDRSAEIMNDFKALQEDISAAFTLIGEIRTALVNAGIMKGSA